MNELTMCCFREGNAVVQPDAGGCRPLAMGSVFGRTRDHLERRHPRCDVHNRPIVFVSVGALAHLPPADEGRAPC